MGKIPIFFSVIWQRQKCKCKPPAEQMQCKKSRLKCENSATCMPPSTFRFIFFMVMRFSAEVLKVWFRFWYYDKTWSGEKYIPYALPHWLILGWNVSKSWLQKADFFENYAIVAMQSDNITFYACNIIKGTSSFNFEENNFFRQLAPSSKKQLKYFSYTNNSTTLMPPGLLRVSREAKSSTEFEFNAIKFGPKPRNFE